MKPFFILNFIALCLLAAFVTKAQRSYLGGGVVISTALSEKTSPRLGVYWQFERALNLRNEILINSGQSHFKTNVQERFAVSVLKAGWRYMFLPGKIYTSINAGIAMESFLTRRYGNAKDYTIHPVIEINPGYLIPYKDGRFDIGLSYAFFFYKYQNFSWLQLNMGYGFRLPHSKKKKDKTQD